MAAKAKEFTKAEWNRIRRELNKNPVRYGLPERVYGSVVIASFNIRKLGKLRSGRSSDGRDEPTMQFLADVCRRFDLVAVQEVMADLSGVRRLRDLMGPEYGLVVSDIVGTFPGESGNEERLAFLYNRGLVRRSELVTEVTTSRTKVLKAIAQHHRELFETMDTNATAKKLREYLDETLPAFREAVKQGKKLKQPREPKFKVEVETFLQFIRTPFAVGFQVLGHPGLERYDFLAVNAHLHFGRPTDRRLEAATLVEWILGKVRSGEGPNTVLLGDLNFDFDKPASDLKRVREAYEALGGFRDAKGKQVYVSFPFIFGHPRPLQDHPPNEVFRSNIGQSQTYDQIGIFSQDERLRGALATTPEGHSREAIWGERPQGPDYGVFDFADLFSRALNGKRMRDLTKTEQRAFKRRFEHKVSDHMPIWFRMPLPEQSEGFPTQG